MTSAGSLAKVRAEAYQEGLMLKVKSLAPAGTRYKCLVSDGAEDAPAILASQLCELVVAGKLRAGASVRLPGSGYSANNIGGVFTLMITALDIVPATVTTPEEPAAPASPVDAEASIQMSSPPDTKKAKLSNGSSHASQLLQECAIASGNPRTPSIRPPSKDSCVNEHGKAPLPGTAYGCSPQPPTQQTTPLSTRKHFHRIDILHPYEDSWCIRAKLLRKQPLRTINGRSGESKLLTVELVDDSGVAIQGTFWRVQAEKQEQELREGRVYVFSRFQVKPANKAYSSVKNDYEISFMDCTEVSEATNQDDSAMATLLDLVPFDGLIKHITRKAPVDVMGVILSMGTLGTVKRKSDNTELQRRDVTLGDKSLKSVTLTLWGDSAANPELDTADQAASILQCTACRATDYNGCSLSTLQKSSITLDPGTKAAEELRSWYNSAGRGAAFTPVGQDAASRQSGAGTSNRDRLSALKDLPASASSAPDAKPEYHNMTISVAHVKEDQSVSYLANVENGRKVVEQEGGLWCEADGKFVSAAEHRYVLSFKAIDHTGVAYLNVFNKEGEVLLGAKADDLHKLKEAGSSKFAEALKAASWREFAVTTSSRGREYNGEVKVRHTAFSLRPIDFVMDGMKMLEIIKRS